VPDTCWWCSLAGNTFFLTIKYAFMKRNMGNTDRFIRILVAAVIGILYYTNIISGTVGIVLLVLAGVFVLTSLISFCPLYSLFGFSTCPLKKAS
jgi:glucan phosphoethanolaminetransferase (alkaline phosphatase superfamily)